MLVISILAYGFSRLLAAFLALSGAVLLLVLIVLLVIEAIQDRRMDRSYRRQRSHPLPVGNGWFECQYCGTRQVRAGDRTCPVCGRELEDAS